MKPTMPERRASLITSISLTPPIFVNANFTPTALNLIYGENGSGKTTLAHAISEKKDLPGRMAQKRKASRSFTSIAHLPRKICRATKSSPASSSWER